MKVTLATHGGQVAALRLGRPPRALDADALTPAQRTELSRLVAAAKSEAGKPGATPEGAAGRGGDVMTYAIRVEDDKEPVAITQSDRGMSPAFAALLDWLHRHLPND
jgi:emfourin